MISLCVTHDQALRSDAESAARDQGFEINPRPVVQIDCGRDPDFGPSHKDWPRVLARIDKLEPGQDAYINWEYPDHYALRSSPGLAQLRVKQTLAAAIRNKGCRAGIYGPVRIQANSMLSTTETSLYHLEIVGHFLDFVVIPVYVGTHFEAGDPAATRYMLNTVAVMREARARLPQSVEIMAAFQFSVRPSGTTREPMTEYEASVMGRVIAASGATPLWWYEAREGNADAIDRRSDESARLGGVFRTGLERHRVDRNMDVGDPQGVE
ncbi:MAG: hypothetical protein JJ916_04280 [Phycisphaerales bacterium]|nr:hypothetical protein [Phycisphaerales bacterium]